MNNKDVFKKVFCSILKKEIHSFFVLWHERKVTSKKLLFLKRESVTILSNNWSHWSHRYRNLLTIKWLFYKILKIAYKSSLQTTNIKDLFCYKKECDGWMIEIRIRRDSIRKITDKLGVGLIYRRTPFVLLILVVVSFFESKRTFFQDKRIV